MTQKRRGAFTRILAAVCVLLALLSTLLLVARIKGVDLGLLHTSGQWVEGAFSFSPSSPWGLLPLPVVLIVSAMMLIALSRRRRIFILLLPLTLAMTYTLYTLSHMLVGSQSPYFAAGFLAASENWRTASLKVVILFMVEVVLFITIVLLADMVRHMGEANERRRLKKQAKREAKAAAKGKVPPVEAVGDPPPLQETVEDRSSIFDVVEPPALQSFSKSRTEEPIPAMIGRPSTGALHTLNEERKRSQTLTLQESKPTASTPVEKEQGAPLSGFLVGALEAIGKPTPKKREETKLKPKGKARGNLAEAVELHQSTAGAPNIIEPVFTQPPPVVEEPVPVPRVVQPTPSPKIERQIIEEPAQQHIETKDDDPLEPASGVGGLSSLINRSKIGYKYPPKSILDTYDKIGDVVDAMTIKRGELLVSTLAEFSISVELTNIVRGPTVTMFELLPAPGIRVNSIASLSDNIALALAATQVRIVAPIPGKSAVGIEIPNKKRDIIGFGEMLDFLTPDLGVPMTLGRDLLNRGVVIDVMKSPHLLIAGSTGSGKSVCVNSLICSILFTRSPKEVRMILVDPKIVELNIYNGIPHLLTPVITDAKRTLKALDFALYEMDRRYRLLQSIGVRNIVGYNEKIKANRLARERLPYILIVIDEFADLMHLVGKEMEMKVSRLAAMSRAVGIHLVLATQRPSVDVITGVIKNNIPTRIAFAVTSSTDSRIILDEMGAEKLLGRGDMLYQSSSEPASIRIQGSFLSDREVEEVVSFVSKQGKPDYIDESFFEEDEPKTESGSASDGVLDPNDDEALMEQALAIVVERKSASASYLQRRLKIGYNRAARLVEQMEEEGYVGPPNGSKPRELIRYP